MDIAKEMDESWELRRSLRSAYVKALGVAFTRHGSPVRLDVVAPAAGGILREGLAGRNISAPIDQMKSLCSGRWASIECTRYLAASENVHKVGPALYLGPRSKVGRAEAELSGAISEVVAVLKFLRRST